MCKQLKVLAKIRKAGKMNGFAVELAEAQAEDFGKVQMDIKNLKQDVADIKTEQARQGEIQAKQSGMIEAIFNRLNGPVEAERQAGQKWNLLVSITKHKAAWVILTLCMFSFALAGDRLASLMGDIIRKLVGA